MLFEEADGGNQILRCLLAIQLANHVASGVLVFGSPTRRRQEVRRQNEKALQGDTSRDILDMRIETAVLVDDDHRRQFPSALGARHVGLDLACGPRIGGTAGLEPRILGRYLCCPRLVGLKQRYEGNGSCGAAGELGQPCQEHATIERCMGVFVVQIDDFLIHGVSLLGIRTKSDGSNRHSVRCV